MGDKVKPWHTKTPHRNFEMKRAIQEGTAKGKTFRDRRDRRAKERSNMRHLLRDEDIEQ